MGRFMYWWSTRLITSPALDHFLARYWSAWPRLAHGASDLFLLSATPVRSNEVAFLDLLHLLDPQNYQPHDLGAFTRRVQMRDELALIHHSLTPDLDEFDFSLYADQLRSMFAGRRGACPPRPSGS